MKIAFVNPPHVDWSLANNAAYLMFQSHYKRFGKNFDRVEWIPAPYKFDEYENVEHVYEEIREADVILFSSYVWNYDIVDLICSHVKQTSPETICVLGGPHVGENDKELLSQRPAYDFILKPTKPGEVFVQELIDTLLEHGNVTPGDLSWEIRSAKTCSQFIPDYSVYEEHLDYLTEMVEYTKKKDIEPFCVLETTRGCPYSCVFCEWGGGTGTKIYKKPMDAVRKDLIALKTAGFRDVFLTDANFGVFFERDIEIFRFAWNTGLRLTDVSTLKSKNLDKRIALIDAWFDVVGNNHDLEKENKFSSIVPTVSLQSVSDEAMKVAKRVDLSFDDKIKLSEHIRFKCQENGFPVPTPEFILGMPGSTINDFYEEFNVLWNFKAWESLRHVYVFLPDTELCNQSYIDQYEIELARVYTDSNDELGEVNEGKLYENKKHIFKTVVSCYSFTKEEFYEMWFMNIACNYLLRKMFHLFEDKYTPSTFGRMCYKILSEVEGFEPLIDEIKDVLNPNTEPRNYKTLQNKNKYDTISNFIDSNYNILYGELFVRDVETFPVKKPKQKVIEIKNGIDN